MSTKDEEATYNPVIGMISDTTSDNFQINRKEMGRSRRTIRVGLYRTVLMNSSPGGIQEESKVT